MDLSPLSGRVCTCRDPRSRSPRSQRVDEIRYEGTYVVVLHTVVSDT